MAVYFNPCKLRIVGMTNHTHNKYKTVMEMMLRPYEDIHYGIKFTSGNVGFSDDIYTFPYFCAFLLKRYLAGEQSEKL